MGKLRGSKGCPDPKAERGGVIDAEVQSRMDYRLVAKCHIHEWKDWKSVKHLQVVFATSSTLRRVRPIESHTKEIILNPAQTGRVIEEEVH